MPGLQDGSRTLTPAQAAMGAFDDMPEECIMSAACYLAVSDLLTLACTCKRLRQLMSVSMRAYLPWCRKLHTLRVQQLMVGLMQDDSVWRKLAANKWGAAALVLYKGHASWMAYTKHRMCLKGTPPSPLALVQEAYADPWQHLVCCLLCRHYHAH